MPNGKLLELYNAYNMMISNEKISLTIWAKSFLLLQEAFCLNIGDFDYISYVTYLIKHAKILSIFSPEIMKMEKSLQDVKSCEIDDKRIVNMLFLTNLFGKQSDIYLYIGKDGKDYSSYETLQIANDLYSMDYPETRK